MEMRHKAIIIAAGAIASAVALKQILKEPCMADWENRQFDPTSEWDLMHHPFYLKWKEVPHTYESFIKMTEKCFRYFDKYKGGGIKLEDLDKRDLLILRIASLEDAIIQGIILHPEQVCDELGISCPFEISQTTGAVYLNFSLDLDKVKQDTFGRFEEAKRQKTAHYVNVREKRKLLRKICSQVIGYMMCNKRTSKISTGIIREDIEIENISMDDIEALYNSSIELLPFTIREQIDNSVKVKLKSI